MLKIDSPTKLLGAMYYEFEKKNKSSFELNMYCLFNNINEKDSYKILSPLNMKIYPNKT